MSTTYTESETEKKHCHVCGKVTEVYKEINICTECLMNPETEFKETKKKSKKT